METLLMDGVIDRLVLLGVKKRLMLFLDSTRSVRSHYANAPDCSRA